MSRVIRSLFPAFLLIGLCGAAHAARVSKPTFNKAHGFYSSSISVKITSSTSGSTIRYTTDASKPTASHGTVLSNGGSVTINRTTCLRACAAKGGMTTSYVFTQTYLYVNDVVALSTQPSDYPTVWTVESGATKDADYEMDPNIVNSSAYSGRIRNDLKALPSISLVLPKNVMFGTSSTVGLYSFGGYHGGENTMEVECSAELIMPGRAGFQIDCGLKGHSGTNHKRSLRLLFKSNYGGPTKLNYPFFEDTPFKNTGSVNSFGKIFMRMGHNDSWCAFWLDDATLKNRTYLRDPWIRRSMIAMTGFGTRGAPMHLYINGMYWGIYDAQERPDARMAADYQGGSKTDWYAINHAGTVSGNSSRYNYLHNTLVPGGFTTSSKYNTLKNYLDVSRYCDYVMLGWYAGTTDWGENNFYAVCRNSPAGGVQYMVWDQDWSLTDGANPGAWVSPAFLNLTSARKASRLSKMCVLWRALDDNKDFMMTFADRVYKHCFNGGPLTDANSKARWDSLVSYLDSGIVCESARWGDRGQDNGNPVSLMKHSHWLTACADVRNNMLNGNASRFISALRAKSYYPSLNPPLYNKHGGSVASGFKLTITRNNSTGTIFYRTDGQDPRVDGGSVRSGSSAGTGTQVVTLTSTSTVKARVKTGATWSALANAAFTVSGPTVPSAPSSLAVGALSTTQLRLSWADNSSNESGFKVERSATGSSGWAQIATVGAGVETYTNGGLSPSTRYYYRVRAYNSAGNSGYSNEANGTTQAPAPVPQIVVSTTSISTSCTQGDNAASKTFQVWNGGDGTLQYKIVESSSLLSVAPTTGSSTGSANKQTHTVTFATSGLAAGTHNRTISVQDNGSDAGNGPITINVTITVNEPAPEPAIAVSTTSIAVSCNVGEDAADSTFQVWNSGTGTLLYKTVEASSWFSIAPSTGSSTGSANKQTHTISWATADKAAGVYTRSFTVEDNGSGAVNGPITVNLEITVSETAPNPPSNLQATALSTTQIRLTWQDNSNNEDGFRVRRSLDGSTFDEITVTAANVTTYTDSGLSASTKYYYMVKATGPDGGSGYTSVATATTQDPAPEPSIAVSTTSIAVSCNVGEDAADSTFQVWNSGTGTLLYKTVEASSWFSIAPSTGSSTGSANKQTHTISWATADKAAGVYTRSFTVEDNGSGAVNGPITVNLEITVSETAPAAPSNLQATALSTTEIALSWQDNSDNEDGFRVRRSLDGSTFDEITVTGANVTTHTDSGLSASTKYYYMVKATGPDGGSGYTSVATATTQDPAPVPQIALSATSIATSCTQGENAASKTFQVWNAGDGTLQYNVVESSSLLSVAPTSGTSTGSADQQTHTVTFATSALTVGTYQRTISIEDNGSGAGNGPLTIDVTITVNEPAPEPAIAVSTTSIAVSCNFGEDAAPETFQVWNSGTGTLLYKLVEASSWFSLAPTTDSSTGSADQQTHTITFTTAAKPAGVFYRSFTVEDNGSGAVNGPITVDLQITVNEVAPAAPSDMQATPVSTTEIALSWQDNSDNEDGFRVRRSLDGVDFYTLPAIVVGPDVTSVVDSGLAPETRYYYKVKATGAGGSAYSNTADATTPATGPAVLFTAYNDLCWVTGEPDTNITKLSGDPGAESGELVNHADGAGTGVRLTVDSALCNSDQGVNPANGTPAADVFEGIVGCQGLLTAGDVTLTLDGLDSGTRYELTVFGNRGVSAYAGRTATFTIAGAYSFQNTSSAGATIGTQAMPNDTTELSTGYNTADGLVAQFADIDAGGDGRVTLTMSSETGGRYINALRVKASEGPALPATTGVVAKGADWKYRPGTSDAPAGWSSVGFDDSGWTAGAAPLGYGPLSYGTALSMQGNYASVCLRKSFALAEPEAVSHLKLDIDYDDGFIVWINGRELARVNVAGAAGSAVAHDATCPGYVSGNQASWTGLFKGMELPALGAENVVAVQLFNNTLASGDAFIDLGLSVALGELSVAEDSDQDRLPDDWETDQLSGTGADPDGDADQDGVLNIEEYAAGTDPESENSYFGVQVTIANGQIEVRIPTIAASGPGYAGCTRYYALEARTGLDAASGWQTVPACSRLLGDGSTIVYSAPLGEQMMIYRARVWIEK